MINFIEFCDLFESVELQPQQKASELELSQVIQLVYQSCKSVFDPTSNVRIETTERTTGSKQKGATIAILTKTRDIDLTLKPYDLERKIFEMEIEFSWNYKSKPTNPSLKDHPDVFSISKQLESETIPILKSFKKLLLIIRNHPIIIIFTPVQDRPLDPKTGNPREMKQGGPNRRDDFYSKILKSCGYTSNGDSTTWIPPVLNF